MMNLDFERQQSYSLSIIVYDDDQQEDTTTLLITLEDANEFVPTTDSSEYLLNISQATAIGSSVLHLKAVDRDNKFSSIISYTITESDSNLFIVDTGGTVRVSETLIVSTVHLTVAISDGELNSTTLIEITIHPPSYTGPLFESQTYQFSLSEATDVGTIVGSVAVTKPANNLSIVSNGNDVPFQIDNGGDIILIQELDYEETLYYVLNVLASGPLGDIYTVLTITVLDYNDNPPLFDNTDYEITLSEFTPITQALLTLSAYDLDSPGINSDVKFDIASGGEYISLNPLTNTLTLSKALDRETNDEITAVLTVSNHLATPVLQTTATVVLTVTDENDNSPQFSQVLYETRVVETTSIGSQVVQVIASDIDDSLNADIVYSITFQDHPSSFGIDQETGAIYTRVSLSGKAGEVYRISVMAADGGVPIPRSVTAEVFVTVFKENLFDPVFSQDIYNISVEETQPVNSVVLTVTATDPDYGDNAVRYTMESDEDIPFVLSPTGSLILTSPLDYVEADFHNLSISATDFGTPARTTDIEVNIAIIDVNNHSPVFSSNSYSTSITENIPILTTVLQVSATDVDAASITYQITVNHMVNGAAVFAINNAGEIFTIGNIDREHSDILELLVSAIDNGYDHQRSTSVPVTITVNDLNDEHPIFNQSEYSIDVIRLTPAQQSILTVAAYEVDILGDKLEYSIVSQTIDGLFAIGRYSGIITTAIGMPEDVQNHTSIIVSVSDGNHTSTVTIQVTTVDNGTFCENNGKQTKSQFDAIPLSFIFCRPLYYCVSSQTELPILWQYCYMPGIL